MIQELRLSDQIFSKREKQNSPLIVFNFQSKCQIEVGISLAQLSWLPPKTSLWGLSDLDSWTLPTPEKEMMR